MKPFDLAAAKRGAPLITRDGRAVTEFHQFETEESKFPCAAIINGEAYWVNLEGRDCYGRESDADLFMAPCKRTVYVNIWEGEVPRGSLYGADGKAPDSARAAHWFDTPEQAQSAAYCGVTGGRSPHCLKVAVPVEIEE
ncbi:hypothetical protein ACVBR5_000873 [Burkholderia cenocepacia]